jgi:hypothetical protein
VSLYHRFCQLDRNGGGFVSADEFMTVPEFAVNPLSQVTPVLTAFPFVGLFVICFRITCCVQSRDLAKRTDLCD